jgi:hypothetical protein
MSERTADPRQPACSLQQDTLPEASLIAQTYGRIPPEMIDIVAHLGFLPLFTNHFEALPPKNIVKISALA